MQSDLLINEGDDFGTFLKLKIVYYTIRWFYYFINLFELIQIRDLIWALFVVVSLSALTPCYFMSCKNCQCGVCMG